MQGYFTHANGKCYKKLLIAVVCSENLVTLFGKFSTHLGSFLFNINDLAYCGLESVGVQCPMRTVLPSSNKVLCHLVNLP